MRILITINDGRIAMGLLRTEVYRLDGLSGRRVAEYLMTYAHPRH